MKILYKYPTRQRPVKFQRCISYYYDLIRGDNYEFIISVDDDDTSMHEPNIVAQMGKMKNLTVVSGPNKTKIEAINANIPNSDWDILVTVSDDMVPEVEGFDNIIRDDMTRLYPDTDGVLWYFDGLERSLNTLCIMGRKYYERFGYIYHPAYKSFWCDNEFTDVANKLGKQTFIDRVIIRHYLPNTVQADSSTRDKFNKLFPEYANMGSCGFDELWKKNSVFYFSDKAIYEQRKSQNFDM